MLDMINVEQIDNKVIMPKEDFEKIIADVDSLIETVEILSDKDMMEQIKISDSEIQESKTMEIKSKTDIDNLFI